MHTIEKATRLIVISDLHLGGNDKAQMMSRPEVLADFIRELPEAWSDSPPLGEDEELELVIAGDFVDFLALPAPGEERGVAWTPDPAVACAKLEAAMGGTFRPVFDALGEHVRAGHRLVVLIGNHDVELALPSVQRAFTEGIGARAHQVRWIDDGRAYRVGGALIEHGNRYDWANQNDWDNLRALVSAQSRNETYDRFNKKLQISAGSVLVEKVVNAWKEDYPFLDLLQPQGELCALLLFAFEPALKLRDVAKIRQLMKTAWTGARQKVHESSGQPGKRRNVSKAAGDDAVRGLSASAERDFEADLKAIRGGSASDVGDPTKTWRGVLKENRTDGLAAIIDRGDPIPEDRLLAIRALMRALLKGDNTLSSGGPAGALGEAADRLRWENNTGGSPVEVVVMGHTHHARHLPPGAEKASYINTGTWADLVTVPDAILQDGAEQAFSDFLIRLRRDDEVRALHASWADIRVEADGSVSRAKLVERAPDKG